jgi:hypothetical protein
MSEEIQTDSSSAEDLSHEEKVRRHAAKVWRNARAFGENLQRESAWTYDLHVPDSARWAFTAGVLDEQEAVIVQEHINGCDACHESCESARYFQSEDAKRDGAASGVARTLMRVVLQALPRAERGRRFEEFYAEMIELSRGQQIRYALSMVVGLGGLRRAMAENAAEAAVRRSST